MTSQKKIDKRLDHIKIKKITGIKIAVHSSGQRVVPQTGPGQGVKMLSMESSINFYQSVKKIKKHKNKNKQWDEDI